MVLLSVPLVPPWGHLVPHHFPIGDLLLPELLVDPPQTFPRQRRRGRGPGLFPLFTGPRAPRFNLRPMFRQLGPWPLFSAHSSMACMSHTRHKLQTARLSAGLDSCPWPPVCPSVCLVSGTSAAVCCHQRFPHLYPISHYRKVGMVACSNARSIGEGVHGALPQYPCHSECQRSFCFPAVVATAGRDHKGQRPLSVGSVMGVTRNFYSSVADSTFFPAPKRPEVTSATITAVRTFTLTWLSLGGSCTPCVCPIKHSQCLRPLNCLHCLF